tara:strand:- start:406 stop:507 length:102 start_codon:yes stop_codon:yes gene_type:complete
MKPEEPINLIKTLKNDRNLAAYAIIAIYKKPLP